MKSRKLKDYRIIYTETRVYVREIGSDSEYDLKEWAREGWENGGPEGDDVQLIERRLEKIEIQKVTKLPWPFSR